MKDGGPAAVLNGVMTLRQWYAGMALQGLLANPHLLSATDLIDIGEGSRGGRYFVAASLHFADAMLAEMEK